MSEQSSQPAEPMFSQRLGAIAPRQFQAALTRFGLGTFVDATPISQGLFGQNVFVSSSHGEFVLRGVPHYPWQFPKERFGATLLHQHTPVPVAYPYLLDTSTDIFGWPYLLMPRLHGTSPANPDLAASEQLDIAQALGHNLVDMQQLTWPAAGAYDLASDSIQPFEHGFGQWIVADIQSWLAAARANGPATTAEDVTWIEQVIGEAHSTLASAFQPCFVMNDYNPGNVLVARIDGTWRVSGVFDLMEYYFGDGEADLMRLIAIYLSIGQHGVRLAQAFASAYLSRKPARRGFAERYALYMLRDRLITWEYGTRPGNNWFAPDQSFRDYAEPFAVSWRQIVSDSAT